MRSLVAIALLAALPAAPASAQDARARAAQLFEESAVLYREGRFEEAAARLREARELHDEPLLSYNLARALEGIGDLEGAITAYRDYLTDAPDAEDAGAVRARIETLGRQREQLRSIAATPPVTPPRTGPGPDPAPWILAGSGAAVAVAGAILAGIAVARRDDADREPTHARTVALLADADAFAIAANVLFAVGGAAALAGAIWGTIDLVSLPNGERASVTLGPGWLGLEGEL
jgi:tetratricopeptide (TPR) repeat protein